MRYLTIEEVERQGYRPHLVFGNKVRSFRNLDDVVVPYGEYAYEAAIILLDGFDCEPAMSMARRII